MKITSDYTRFFYIDLAVLAISDFFLYHEIIQYPIVQLLLSDDLLKINVNAKQPHIFLRPLKTTT